jgi:hypothetical protein
MSDVVGFVRIRVGRGFEIVKVEEEDTVVEELLGEIGEVVWE